MKIHANPRGEKRKFVTFFAREMIWESPAVPAIKPQLDYGSVPECMKFLASPASQTGIPGCFSDYACF